MIVIAGKSRGETSIITRVLPERNLVLLDGMNLVKRHRKPNRQGGKGQIVDKPMPIHASNVQLLDPKSGKPTRIKIVRDAEGTRTRVAVKSGEELK